LETTNWNFESLALSYNDAKLTIEQLNQQLEILNQHDLIAKQ
jgi:hypothetical protein